MNKLLIVKKIPIAMRDNVLITLFNCISITGRRCVFSEDEDFVGYENTTIEKSFTNH